MCSGHLSSLIGHGVAVEEIAHGFVEVALALACGSEESGALALGETEAERCCWERREGTLRSVEEDLKVCANQPERRVGRSVMRALELGE